MTANVSTSEKLDATAKVNHNLKKSINQEMVQTY